MEKISLETFGVNAEQESALQEVAKIRNAENEKQLARKLEEATRHAQTLRDVEIHKAETEEEAEAIREAELVIAEPEQVEEVTPETLLNDVVKNFLGEAVQKSQEKLAANLTPENLAKLPLEDRNKIQEILDKYVGK